jgi:hypothetical protein
VTAEKYSIKEALPTSVGRIRSAAIPNSAGSLTTVSIFGAKIKGTDFLVPPTGEAKPCPVFNLADSIDWSTVKCTVVGAASDRTDHRGLFGRNRTGGIGIADGHDPPAGGRH